MTDGSRIRVEIEAGRYDVAVDLGESLLSTFADDPVVLFWTARAYEWLATTQAAVSAASHSRSAELYRLALQQERRAETAYRLGLELERLKDWPASAEAYSVAVEIDASNSPWFYRLGWVAHLAGQTSLSRESYSKALYMEEGNPEYLHRILESSTSNFLYKQRVATFIRENLKEIERERALVARSRSGLQVREVPVFIYWAQGFDSAPPIVRSCVASFRKAFGSRVVEISDEVLAMYVDIDPMQTLRVGENRTHFSDVLRMELLARYGGVWVDATCLAGPGIASFVDESLRTPFFAHDYGGPSISSWFMTAQDTSVIPEIMAAALRVYWRKKETLTGYFMLHHFFECLYYVIPEFAAEWDGRHAVNAKAPHRLQQAMFSRYSADEFNALLSGHFVHKLTYKFDSVRVNADSVLAAIVRGAALVPRV